MNTFLLRIFIFVFICFGLQNKSYATHIVGGELLIEWTGVGEIYRIKLNKYLNDISVRTYGFTTNTLEYVEIRDVVTDYTIANLTLQMVTNGLLGNNSNACTNPAVLQTSLQVYIGVFDLSLLDASGRYYLTWDDCCRNEDIINLYSPTAESVALYTAFNGWRTRNSTPQFLPLSNEFFCRNSLNTFNMGAVDPDGDELRYSLITPRSSVAPSIDVVWGIGSSGSNPIPGTVPFSIHPSTGVITFNPSSLGIFVFGIMVEEYRNGNKISEIRRDFQFTVQDCPINNKPEIAFQNRAIKTNDTLTIQLKDKLCFPIYVTDVDAANMFMSQTIQIRQSPNNTFPVAALSLPTEVNLTGFRPTAFFDLCLDPCAGGLRLNETTYYPHEIIITDNRCPIQYDTLNFTIKVEVSPNISPEIFIDPITNPKIVNVNNTLMFDVYATDTDAADVLTLTMYNGQRAMSFQNVTDSTSTISSTFNWTPNCNDLEPGTYDIYFIAKDNSCSISESDTIFQKIIVEDLDADFSNINVTNLITPNGDGLNDFYYVPGIPVGNCEKYFKGIEIYNRWGAPVFYSEDRFFKWDPKESDGIYYFSIDLNYKTIKGWIQIVR